MIRPAVPAIAMLASFCAGCDDEDEDRRARPHAEPPVAADRSLQRPPPLGTGVVLRGRYQVWPFAARWRLSGAAG